jgi:hypothetical protein
MVKCCGFVEFRHELGKKMQKSGNLQKKNCTKSGVFLSSGDFPSLVQLDPPRVLDSKCILKAMYLVTCHSDASVYSLTNSAECLHGGLWYFHLLQLFALANSMNVLDRIVVVGYDESFEDDVIIALNGQEVMSLASIHEINFEGVQNCTEGGESDVRCNNINITYGYVKQGFESEANKDGLH